MPRSAIEEEQTIHNQNNNLETLEEGALENQLDLSGIRDIDAFICYPSACWDDYYNPYAIPLPRISPQPIISDEFTIVINGHSTTYKVFIDGVPPSQRASKRALVEKEPIEEVLHSINQISEAFNSSWLNSEPDELPASGNYGYAGCYTIGAHRGVSSLGVSGDLQDHTDS